MQLKSLQLQRKATPQATNNFVTKNQLYMAHNLNNNNGKWSFMSVKEKAWHSLGQVVEDYPNSREALQFAGLDFEVVKRPNRHLLDNGETLTSTTSFFTYRTDTGAVLGDRLGAEYQVVQNVDAFNFFDAIVGGDGILYETAGCLYDGQKVFITAKLPDYIKVGREDLIEKYLFLTTSHDGSGSITAAFTPVRIVCCNTLNMALRNCSNTVKIRHTQNAQDRLKEAHKVMGIANTLTVQLEDIFNQWAKVRITDTNVKKLIQLAMVPNREVLRNIQTGKLDDLSTCFMNICDNAFEYAMSSPTQLTDTTRGTLFGAYNAVTGYFQNVRNYKDDEAKFKSIMNGTGLLRTQTTFGLCDDYAKRGVAALN
jgi:phage/plasmid-like protein (TIGR03299 family)